jgi:hypothetical protein
MIAPMLRGGFVAWRRLVLAAACLIGPASTVSGVSDPYRREYQIKGVLLYHFLEYVTWPAPSPGDREAPFVIGILGDDPFGRTLDVVTREERVGGRRIEIERYSSAEGARSCHILFVARSERERWPEIAAILAGRAILTVADFEGFAESQGMVEFFTSEDRIRMKINLTTVRAHGLTMSARLLRVADVIPRTGD